MFIPENVGNRKKGTNKKIKITSVFIAFMLDLI